MFKKYNTYTFNIFGFKTRCNRSWYQFDTQLESVTPGEKAG